ncbi:hypothetical protein GF406_07255 [candidate division KSB1 bacterium]|nr:hypothetical protein [candidate division KSB1 bacterium]
MNKSFYLLFIIWGFGIAQMQPQCPSPMTDTTRKHERICADQPQTTPLQIQGLAEKSVTIFVDSQCRNASSYSLWIHFHGTDYVPVYAMHTSARPEVLVTINLGAGSSRYETPFQDKDLFGKILKRVKNFLTKNGQTECQLESLNVSAFSAGYGAVRALLQQPKNAEQIRAILLLDGLHTGYIPAGQPLAQDGQLNTEKLDPFVRFARQAVANEKSFVFTHSEIFPGTYASTTECADYLIEQLGLERKAVLNWGPLGMQQLSKVCKGHFQILGYAGNTAPDHIDHFHGLYEFIKCIH